MIWSSPPLGLPPTNRSTWSRRSPPRPAGRGRADVGDLAVVGGPAADQEGDIGKRRRQLRRGFGNRRGGRRKEESERRQKHLHVVPPCVLTAPCVGVLPGHRAGGVEAQAPPAASVAQRRRAASLSP